MQCPNCDHEIKEEIKFCGYCGFKLVHQDDISEDAPTRLEHDGVPPTSTTGEREIYDDAATRMESPSSSQGSTKNQVDEKPQDTSYSNHPEGVKRQARICPACRKSISFSAKVCSHCGTKLQVAQPVAPSSEPTPARRMKIPVWGWVLSGILAIACFVIIIFGAGNLIGKSLSSVQTPTNNCPWPSNERIELGQMVTGFINENNCKDAYIISGNKGQTFQIMMNSVDNVIDCVIGIYYIDPTTNGEEYIGSFYGSTSLNVVHNLELPYTTDYIFVTSWRSNEFGNKTGQYSLIINNFK